METLVNDIYLREDIIRLVQYIAFTTQHIRFLPGEALKKARIISGFLALMHKLLRVGPSGVLALKMA